MLLPVRVQARVTLPEALRARIDAVRMRWNPEVAAGNPAHFTIIYHDEAPDPAVLRARLEHACRKVAEKPLTPSANDDPVDLAKKGAKFDSCAHPTLADMALWTPRKDHSGLDIGGGGVGASVLFSTGSLEHRRQDNE
jgi:hypothetical protein